MKFYTVKDKYIAYLKTLDTTVPNNYSEKRPYIGIVLEVDSHKFIAPLTSYKPKQDRIKNSNPTVFKLHERTNPLNKLGMIQLNNMVPVLISEIDLFDIENQPEPYKSMLYKQYEFIKTHEDKILHRSKKLFQLVKSNRESYFGRLCCSFELLLSEYQKYQS